ncbi:hypothetical protein [Streptomyces phaeoluteigriseus]|uniref:hypothetical protein n=1 Tax=Streptomyces phaeoluteigriseus TaxID=114686 RepID=UPI0036AFB3BF
MSRNLVQIALPCRRLTLKVVVCPEDGRSVLEDLVMKAVAAEVTTVEGLAELFVLPYRVALDVVASLWGRGLLSVDLVSGRFDLGDSVRETMNAASDSALKDASAVTESRDYLYEPVSGSFFPDNDGTHAPPHGTLRAPVNESIRAHDLPPRELLAAVQAATARDRNAGYRRRILSVGFGNPLLRPADDIRWLTVSARIQIDEDTDRLNVLLDESEIRTWSVQAGERIHEYLATLGDERPDFPLVQELRGAAERVLVAQDGMSKLFRRLDDAIDRLAGPDRLQGESPEEDLPKEMESTAWQIQDRTEALRQARARLTPVQDAQGHLWALRDLLAQARTQVVIVTPTIHYAALNPLLSELRSALDRGIRLVVSWGRTPSDSLPPEVRTAFSELAFRYKSQVLLSQRSARTGGCVMVQDNLRALISSHSLLELSAKSGARSLGVLIEPSEHGTAAPQCIAELLRRLQRSWYPGQEAMQIRSRSQDFSVDSEDEAAPLSGFVPVQAPARPADSTPEMSRIWLESWREHREALFAVVQAVVQEDPSVTLVEDGAHDDFLWQALHGASRRLVLADDRVSPQAATERVATTLRERAAEGADVYVVHPRLPDSDAVKSFAALAGSNRANLVVRRTAAAARVVIADDTVQIGSFAPLGHARVHVEGRSETSGQLGIRVQSGAFAADVASMLGMAQARAPRSAGTVSGPAGRPAGTGAVAAACGALVRVRQAPRTRYGEVLTEVMSGLDDPWRLLEVWQDQGVPASDIRRGAATLLRLRDLIPDTQRDRWAGWLVGDAWGRHHFVEASLIGRLLPGEGGGLTSHLCVAAVPVELGPLGPRLGEAVSALESDHANAVGAVGGLAEVLFWDGRDGEVVVDVVGDALPRVWQEYAENAVAHARGTRRALPLDLFAAQLSSAPSAAEVEAQWGAVAELLDQIRRRRQRFSFNSGLAIHDGLFGSDGLLTHVERAARGDVLTRTELVPRLHLDLQEHMDRLVSDAGEQAVEWRKQRPYFRRIESLVLEARRLSYHGEARDGAAPEIERGWRDFAAATALHWNALSSEADAFPDPYRHPLSAVLHRLGPAAQWSREHR